MSDDQSDFSGKPRHRAALTPDNSVARDGHDARKEKVAKKAGTKSARGKNAAAAGGDSAPDLSAEEKAKPYAGRKAVTKKVVAKTERRKNAAEESAPAPALSDEEKANARAARKAEKHARKAEAKAKRRKDAAAEDSAPVPSDEEKAKARAARKAEKHAKKAEAKAERRKDAAGDAAPALTDEEKAKARAERKAQKAEKKAEAKAERRDSATAESISAPVLSDEEKAEARAQRKAEKAAKKAEAKADQRKDAVAGNSAPVLSEEEKANARAQRKAEKAAKKAEVKASRQKDAATDNSAPVLSEEEKANARARRKIEKAAKKSEAKADRRKDAAVGDSASELSDEEKAKARAERKAGKKAERKNRGGEDADDDGDDAGGRVLQIALRGLSENSAARLRGNIEAALTAAGAAFEWAKEGDKPGLAIHAFENPPAGPEEIASRIGDIAKDRAKLRVFIGRVGPPEPDGSIPFAAENKAIAMLAVEGEDAFVDVVSLFRRYDSVALLENGQPTDAGCDLIANAVMAIAAGAQVAKGSVPYPQRPVPPDLAEARALAPTDILSQLSWNDPSPPKLLWTRASKESVEAFMDGKIALSQEQTLDLNLPITWPAELADRASGIQAVGLEFLSGPLNYWYARAGNRNTDQIAEIDAFLKERGAVASDILARAGKIIVDFADNHPLSTSAAWEESAVSRRARVLALFVLCCKMASKRKVKFDEAVFVRVFGELLNLIEVLRSDDFYRPGSFDAVQQDSLLIGLALTLRRTAYAERLLKDSIARLGALQLNVGLTGDGVWRMGSFSDHCALLSQFKIIIGDFDKADMALIEPVATAAKKMTVFAEAMLKSSGAPPSFDDSRDKSFLKKLSGTRRALAGAGFSKSAPQRGKAMPRVTDTYVFRDAQYFASHSTQKPSSDSSLVILHAEPASALRHTPGGIVLAFAHADTDLLIRADPPEGTKKRNKAAHHDAALRNGYHINDAGYVAGEETQLHAARLIKSWRGPGWAAAKSIDETNPAGSVSRVVLHLKAQHALMVVDELVASDGTETAFEQFWHVAPGLMPTETGGAPLRFPAPKEGGLTIAFDAQGATMIDPEGEGGHCVRRTIRLAKGVVASLFQWTDTPAPAALKVESAALGDWSITLSGGGFDGRLSLAGDDLRYEPHTIG